MPGAWAPAALAEAGPDPRRAWGRGTAVSWWWWVLLALVLGLCAAFAEQRFPPPDFTSGYQVPHVPHAAPRQAVWEWLDAVVLCLGLGVASWLTLKRRSRRGIVALSLFSVAYFGFYRQGCVCAIGSVQNVALALADRSYAVPWVVLIFFVAPLVTALFFGRSFCAGVCPHGALQDLVLVKAIPLPRWLEQALGLVPYLFLGAGVALAATGAGFVICRLDPFIPLFRLSGGMTMVITGVAFVAAALFIGRPYCRFLCPYGALLRMAAAVSRWRVRITPDRCTQCRLCENACPFGVIREPVQLRLQGEGLRAERRRFLLWAGVLPLLVAGGVWLGGWAGAAAGSLHKDVALAELHLQQQSGQAVTHLATADELGLARAARSADTLLPAAVDRRRALVRAGWWFGGWAGLVLGLRLVGFSLWRRHADYEPDQAGCVGCARCFLSCPQERVRLGLMKPEDAPQGPPGSKVPQGLQP